MYIYIYIYVNIPTYMYTQVLDANLQSSCRDIVFDPSFSGQVLDLLEGHLGRGAVSDDDLLCMGMSMLVRFAEAHMPVHACTCLYMPVHACMCLYMRVYASMPTYASSMPVHD